MELSARKKQILKRVIEDYIASAEPVGSKAIAQEMGGSVSSATVRNELAELSDLGYLEQPHTSAGRVPSPKGYRLYVNELMERREVSEAEAEEINETLQDKMSAAGSMISQAEVVEAAQLVAEGEARGGLLADAAGGEVVGFGAVCNAGGEVGGGLLGGHGEVSPFGAGCGSVLPSPAVRRAAHGFRHRAGNGHIAVSVEAARLGQRFER